MTLSPEQAARYLRQILLAEVGVSGQLRICALQAAVRPHSAAGRAPLRHWVAERYVRRAGVVDVVPGEIPTSRWAPSPLVVNTPAREVLAGARAALAVLRAAVVRPTGEG